MNLIWATRGRTWGFCFLLDGGFADPLPEYDAAFSGTEGDPTVCRRIGDKVALRFADPLGRTDRSGRVIPHDFVVSGALADRIGSFDQGRELVWSLVGEEYAVVWDEPGPPTVSIESI